MLFICKTLCVYQDLATPQGQSRPWKRGSKIISDTWQQFLDWRGCQRRVYDWTRPIQPEKTLALHPTSYDILYPSNRQKKQWSIESVIVAQAWSTIVPEGLRSSGSLHLIIDFCGLYLPIPPFVYFVFVGLFLLFFFLFLIHSFMCSSIIYLFGCRLYLSAICHYYCM